MNRLARLKPFMLPLEETADKSETISWSDLQRTAAAFTKRNMAEQAAIGADILSESAPLEGNPRKKLGEDIAHVLDAEGLGATMPYSEIPRVPAVSYVATNTGRKIYYYLGQRTLPEVCAQTAGAASTAASHISTTAEAR